MSDILNAILKSDRLAEAVVGMVEAQRKYIDSVERAICGYDKLIAKGAEGKEGT